MPVCCDPVKVNFFNASSTSIVYDETMVKKFGAEPSVIVYYYDSVTGEFYLSEFPFTQMKFDGTNIDIDHGGPATGIVVIH